MKQLLQNLKDGNTLLEEVSIPKLKDKHLLISSKYSLVSIGTEKMLINFGKANYIQKAKQQPDKVKEVFDKIKTDGLISTYDAVKSKLNQPIPLGYCNTGIVVDSKSENFKIGDRVVSNGPHAEFVNVPQNLCAKIPDSVDDESASFTVIGSISLQGIRLLKPEIGETIIVIGLGLIGLISVQILKANGCNVIGIDVDESKCAMAKSFGAQVICSKNDDMYSQKIIDKTNGNGADGVLISASTPSNDVIHQSAQMSRKKGRIILIGVVGLDIRRDDFYEKELTFQVSASYGPGRYDNKYEVDGIDYPIGYVRWTEQRNFEAILNLMENGLINMKPLISNIVNFEEAPQLYQNIDSKNSLGILLSYKNSTKTKPEKSIIRINETDNNNRKSTKINFGLIGAGNYSSRVLLPIFKKHNLVFNTIVTNGGLNGTHHGKNSGFEFSSTQDSDIWNNKEINTVAIVTQHNTHADFVKEAIKSNKHIFVEKPLAIDIDDVKNIEKLLKDDINLMVGFNRRFSKHSIKVKELLNQREQSKAIIITVNAGHISPDHWVQDKKIGGGRIIGEACHFIDLLRFYIGYPISSYNCSALKNSVNNDSVIITLKFEDGSVGTINYLANGGSSFPKEKIEIFCDKSIIQIDNFRKMKGFNWPGFKRLNLWRQDKGQENCVEAFLDSIEKGKPSPISKEEIFEVSKLSIEIANSIN